MRKQVSMGAVYAPPELMQERTNVMRKDKVYPFNQAHLNGEDITESEANKSITNEVYASPRMFGGLANGKRITHAEYDSPQSLNDSENDRSNVKRDISAAGYENAVKRKVSYCMHCGDRVLENMRFCPNCGMEENVALNPEDTSMYCSYCHSDISPLSHYCPYCGTPTYRVNERERENITSVLYGPPTVMKKGIVSKIRDLLKRK